MNKPIPIQIKFSLDADEGWIKLNNQTIEVGHGEEDRDDFYSSKVLRFQDKTHTAYVLLSIAKVLFDQIGSPEASKKALLESGLLEEEALERVSNLSLNALSLGLGLGNDKPQAQERKPSTLRPKASHADKTGLLRQEVKATLLESGIDPDTVACFDNMSGYALALNNSTNPVKAAMTMSGKPQFGPILADFRKRQAKPNGRDSAAAPNGSANDEEVVLPKGLAFQIDED